MTNIYNNQPAFQSAIKKINGVEFPNCCYWSSSEISPSYAANSMFDFPYGLVGDSSKDLSDYAYVRPVLEF